MSEPVDAERLIAVNVANFYAGPSTSDEQVTQALMGASVSVRETQGGFCFARTEDRYEGWVPAQHLVPVWDDSDYFPTSIATLFAEAYFRPDAQSELRTKLTVGTRVLLAHRPEAQDYVPLIFPDRSLAYVHKICLNMTHEGTITGPDLLDQKARRAIDLSSLKRQVLTAVGAQAARVGMRFIGTPYLWGGSSAFGLDCSGFVQLAYRLSGIRLLCDAELQWHDKRFVRVEEGKTFREAILAAGDLVVFSRSGDRATHIGLALGDGRFIHASGRRNGVYLDSCDESEYEATYLGSVRISADADLAIEAA